MGYYMQEPQSLMSSGGHDWQSFVQASAVDEGDKGVDPDFASRVLFVLQHTVNRSI